MALPDAAALARYDGYVDCSGGPDACWPWTRSVGTHGYGVFYAGGMQYLTHRLALERSLGRPLLPDERSRHDCDNKPCCNPAHLRPGSHGDNMQDAADRGLARAGRKAVPVCANGHAMTPDNVRHYTKRHPKTGKEYACQACRQCNIDYLRRWRQNTSTTRRAA